MSDAQTSKPIPPLSLKVMTMYRDCTDSTILILGEVLPDTVEYDEGLRFFGTEGIMYKPNGHIAISASSFDLIREATEEEIAAFAPAHRLFNLEGLPLLPDLYIPADHPDFTVTPDGKYVNRMGILEEIEKALFKFQLNGRRFSDGRMSMNDLIYQIRQP